MAFESSTWRLRQKETFQYVQEFRGSQGQNILIIISPAAEPRIMLIMRLRFQAASNFQKTNTYWWVWQFDEG